MYSRFFLVVLAVKVWPWELWKVKDDSDSWDAPRKPLYNLRVLRDRVCVRSVGVQ